MGEKSACSSRTANGCSRSSLVDTAWRPDGLRCWPLLPGNFGGAATTQALRQLAGLLVVAWNALVQRRTVVVCLTRDWYDELVLAAVARLGGRVVVVAHDPEPKSLLSRRQLLARRLLWRAAHRLLTHGPVLATQASAIAGRTALEVPHPPFCGWAAQAPPRQASDTTRLVLVGHLRPDKGIDRLPALLSRLSDADRERWHACPSPDAETSQERSREISALVLVVREPSSGLLPDSELGGSPGRGRRPAGSVPLGERLWQRGAGAEPRAARAGLRRRCPCATCPPAVLVGATAGRICLRRTPDCVAPRGPERGRSGLDEWRQRSVSALGRDALS